MGKTIRANASAIRRPKRSQAATRDAWKKTLEAAFRAEFPHDTVDVSDGYKDNIHVLVVSRRFDGMPEQNKQDWLWGIIDRTKLPRRAKLLISLVLPLSPADIK